MQCSLNIFQHIFPGGLSPGAIAGIVIGSVAGVALMAGLAAFFLLKKKGKMNKKSKSNTDPVPTPRAQQRSPDMTLEEARPSPMPEEEGQINHGINTAE